MSASQSAPPPSLEIYPMPAFPVLAVRDLARSSAWYQEALGFRFVFAMPGPGGAPVLVHLRWARYGDLLLRAEDSGTLPGTSRGVGVTLTFAVNAETPEATVDALADRLARHRAAAPGPYTASLVAAPADEPWNARECTIADPDGFHLTFTFGPLRALDMDAIVARARGEAG